MYNLYVIKISIYHPKFVANFVRYFLLEVRLQAHMKVLKKYIIYPIHIVHYIYINGIK